MARLRDSGRTSLSAPQQPRNPRPESIARNPYDTFRILVLLDKIEWWSLTTPGEKVVKVDPKVIAQDPLHSLPNGPSGSLTQPVLPHPGDGQRTVTKTDGAGTPGRELTEWSSWKGQCSKHGSQAAQCSSCL